MIGILFFLFVKCGRVEERIPGEMHMMLACAKARSHQSCKPLLAVGGIQA